MKIAELITLLPCHTLGDFPLHHRGAEAAGLLAAWTAPWHPALVAAAGAIPRWHRADDPPSELANRLLVIPSVVQVDLPSGFMRHAEQAGAVVLHGLDRREQLLSAALAHVEHDSIRAVDKDLAADFLALGYAHLQSELLAERMRYVSHLNQPRFAEATLAAAQAAVYGDAAGARERLRQAFALLMEARGQFYPVDNYLLDFTLVADTTLGPALAAEIGSAVARALPTNLLLPAALAVGLARDEPATAAELRAALAAGQVDLIGGEIEEGPLALLPLEAILSELRAGLRAYEQALGQRPHVFGRRRTGLSPALPQVLQNLGFHGALHFTLDDGRFPQSERGKTRWEGSDGSAIDALGRVPLDAASDGDLLRLCELLGDAMDFDHVATLSLAHWPGRVSPYYEDLRRATSYAPVLGKFVTATRYFEETEHATHYARFSPDEYRSPYLMQAVERGEADAISRLIGRIKAGVSEEAVGVLDSCAAAICGAGANVPAPAAPSVEPADRLAAAAMRLQQFLPRAAEPPQSGCLVLNSASFARRIGLELPALAAPPVLDGVVRAADEAGDGVRAVVEVPACGFAWVGPGTEPSIARRVSRSIAADHALRNQRIDVVIHPSTGGIKAIYDRRTRGNRLSQQLACRLPAPHPAAGEPWRDAGDAARYSRMCAESIEVTASSAVFGEITSRGRLCDEQEQPLARFVQRVQLWSDSAIVVVDIELDSLRELPANPWEAYYACRFAWQDAGADLFRSVHLGRFRTSAQRIEAPHFVEVDEGGNRTAILTGGLPYHRRSGMRMLDSLLVVRGESQRRFRLGVGLDLAHPWQAATELLLPETCFADETRPATPVGWLFHVDMPNVAITHLQPMVGASGIFEGVRARLLEVEGRAVGLRLRCCRPPQEVVRTDYFDELCSSLPIRDDAVLVDLAAHEWMQIAMRW